MRLQSKSPFAYALRNIFYFLPFVALPAVMLAFFQAPDGPAALFRKIADTINSGNAIVFDDFYNDLYGYFSFVNVKPHGLFGINSIWFWLLTMVVTFVGLCCSLTMVERHIKFGTHSFKAVLKNFFGSISALLPYVALMFVAYHLIVLLLSGAIVLLSVIAKGWTFFVLGVVFTVFFYIVYFIFLGLFMLTPPSMYFDGYRFWFAMAYSAQIVGRRFWEFTLKIIVMVICTQLLIVGYEILSKVVGFSQKLGFALGTLLRFLMYLWWLMILPSYSACKYAEYTETKRGDLKIKIFD